jgi:uracil-DNA glycosylase family 4
LSQCPIPGSTSWCDPEGSGANGVLILGEACGDAEARDHLPFRPYAPSGSVLERAIRRCGYNREQFVIFNVCPVQPPKNFLEGAPYETEAIQWGSEILEGVIAKYKPRCILTLGNIPLKATTGLAGEKLSVSHLRGWMIPALSRFSNVSIPVVATFHPSFLRRGAMALFSVLMHDLKLSIAVANARMGQTVAFHSPVLSRDVHFTRGPLPDLFNPVVPAGYTTHPLESQAWEFLKEAEDDPRLLIGFDIETPRSSVTSELESDELEDRDILSIQFSLHKGSGIFLPWREPFIEISKRILALPNEKGGANVWRFDCPLLEAHGCRLNGTVHDVRWMWHAMQPDLRASLQFIASFYNDGSMAPYKHLHQSYPGYYGIADVDWIERIICD